MKKIAIWAPLKYSNYGDDLQAILLGTFIKRQGYEIITFQLEENLSKLYNLQTANNEKELLSGASLCIIAGGSFLMPINPFKRWLHKNYREIENSYVRLYKYCLKFKVPILPISIGGDGKCHKIISDFPFSRYLIIKSKLFLNGTVRIENDLNFLKTLGKKFYYYPDMLLQSGKMMNLDINNKTNTYKKRIGINFKNGKYLDKKLLDNIFRYALEHDDLEFYFIKSHMDCVNINYEFMPNDKLKNIYCIKYETPSQLLSFLSSLHCVISSIHVGLTAISVGTPFISYRGQGKTHAFLQSIGGEWAIVKNDINFEELNSLYFKKNKADIFNLYNKEKFLAMTENSKQHYEFCMQIINELTSK